jgi:sodium transport system permease protein
VSLEEQKIQVGSSDTSEFLVGFLPYLIVVYAFYGGFGSGSDSVAGEKEKMTLETLLIAPVGRSQIAFGKFIAIAVICFLSSFSALMGVVVAGMSGLPMYTKLFPNGLGVNGAQFGTMLLVLVPTVAFFASMLLAVSAFAKNTRESQSYLAMISLVVLMPAIFGQFIGFTDLASNWWIRLIPVLNTSVSLREILQGKTDPTGVGITIAVGAVLAFIGIRIAVHLFKREEVLTRV